MSELHAASISRAVVDQVRAPGFQARVLHAFPRALNLLTDDGAVVTLADPSVGDGPLNVVVPARFDRVSAGVIARGDGECLRVDGLMVALAGATPWEPRWSWERRLLVPSPQSSVASRQSVVCGRRSGWLTSLASQAADVGIARLRTALHTGDAQQLAEAAGTLAGLGPGLTPAGDDFLVGVMWGLRFRPGDGDVDILCAAIVEAAAPRTTPLSAALLRAAGAGLADSRWHALFDALDRGVDIATALDAVLAQGATSGADAWAGFQLVDTLVAGSPLSQPR